MKWKEQVSHMDKTVTSGRSGRALEALLWLVLTLGVGVNVAGPFAGVSEWVTLPAGVLVLVLGAWLVVLHMRRRRA
jgi:ABC-type nickel/cobalt efflux system permease component RcnA